MQIGHLLRRTFLKGTFFLLLLSHCTPSVPEIKSTKPNPQLVPPNSNNPAPTQPTNPTNPTTPPSTTPTIPVTPVTPVVPGNSATHFELPSTLGLSAIDLKLGTEPNNCTNPEQMPQVVSESIKLCANQSYQPFRISGAHITIFGDKTATIQTSGRNYAITIADGSDDIIIQNVSIKTSTDPADKGIILCIYPDCGGKVGGISYGGGILARGTNITIVGIEISGGGVIGIAADKVVGLKLINNHLDNFSGWGSYNYGVQKGVFLGNSFNNDNRSCTTPGGDFWASGCESAGFMCVTCRENIIAANTCTNSGDCYYMNGENNLNSDQNRFHKNECLGSPHNCFEVTFSQLNEFVENTTGKDPTTGAPCKYPFWVGGSKVAFARNQWSCEKSPQTSLNDAKASTPVPTQIDEK